MSNEPLPPLNSLQAFEAAGPAREFPVRGGRTAGLARRHQQKCWPAGAISGNRAVCQAKQWSDAHPGRQPLRLAAIGEIVGLTDGDALHRNGTHCDMLIHASNDRWPPRGAEGASILGPTCGTTTGTISAGRRLAVSRLDMARTPEIRMRSVTPW